MSLINHINRPKLMPFIFPKNFANISPNMAPKIMVSMIIVAEIVIISPAGISNSPIIVPIYPKITPTMPPINPATAPAPPPLFRGHSPPVKLMILYLF